MFHSVAVEIHLTPETHPLTANKITPVDVLQKDVTVLCQIANVDLLVQDITMPIKLDNVIEKNMLVIQIIAMEVEIVETVETVEIIAKEAREAKEELVESIMFTVEENHYMIEEQIEREFLILIVDYITRKILKKEDKKL